MPQRSTNGAYEFKGHFVCFVLLCGFISFLWVPCAKGASLYGRVIEVNSGDVLTVFNLNRPVRVKLLGVDAPELNQPFGDVAKKHLTDLLMDKGVLVEYSGIGADSSLTGRVLLNDTDIGAQMIRDGAAWFDTNTNRLSATHREVYQQSEQAARNERRGLWQDENPIAPWEFVKAEALRRNPAATLKAMLPQATATPKQRPFSELTNLTLMTRGITAAPRPSSPAATSLETSWTPGTKSANWRWLRPAGTNFSALVPDNGKQSAIPVPGGTMENDIYLGRDGWSVYAVMWTTGPTLGETDKDVISVTMETFLKGVGQGFQTGAESVGRPAIFVCELENEKSISQSGYTGSEFDLKSCTVPARARAFTKVVDNERQLYLAVVFYMKEDDNVSRFIKSFTVGTAQATKRHKKNQ